MAEQKKVKSAIQKIKNTVKKVVKPSKAKRIVAGAALVGGSQARCSDFLGNGAGLQEVKAEAANSFKSQGQIQHRFTSTVLILLVKHRPARATGSSRGRTNSPPLLRKPVKEFAPISILSYPIMLSLCVFIH